MPHTTKIHPELIKHAHISLLAPSVYELILLSPKEQKKRIKQFIKEANKIVK